jgi:hypothetical protein
MNHPDHPDWFEVKFRPEAIEDFGIAFPEMPPGDEIVLWMKLEPCSGCGEMPADGSMAAIDPEYVTDEGLLVGRQLCQDCLEEEAYGAVP